ncbi:unnamed protein product [Bursaphelenchus xylophilus]|uniref:(pine wood nematode) hypothetical protein n=1 Tax=Bursaphelenchus xylophilus TaxID=6326 RepID=A0A1I7RXE7_BURXY|nr:unnamed protein product [Bursaphelenchus xylophilus]CAG9126335.1 unnamed protein product [Bursaphelenchus xylophilus]
MSTTNYNRFVDKTVIVTGSSSGIGREIALEFAREGANVVIHGQREEKLKETTKLLEELGIDSTRFTVVKGPIQEAETQDNLINDTLNKFGRIDVIVNNAGVSHDSTKDPDPNSAESLDFVYKVNMKSIFTLTAKAIPYLSKTKGNVINISSVGSQRVCPLLLPYTVMKAALDHYTRGAAIIHAKDNVRVNSVNPGFIDSEFTVRHGVPQSAFDNSYHRFGKVFVPMQRIGYPKEVARTVLFVASEDASYTTGAIFNVDGGSLAGPITQLWTGEA